MKGVPVLCDLCMYLQFVSWHIAGYNTDILSYMVCEYRYIMEYLYNTNTWDTMDYYKLYMLWCYNICFVISFIDSFPFQEQNDDQSYFCLNDY